MDQKKILISAAILYFFTFAWIFLLTHGLPIGDVDDWVCIQISENLSWKESVQNLIRPWSKSQFWSNQVDLIDQIAFKRTVHGILLKSASVLFSTRSLAFFILKGLFFSGTVAFLFLILIQITRSIWFSLAGVLFFVLVPVHYAHILWASDPATVLHFFIILSVWIFYHVGLNLERRESLRKFLPVFLAFSLTGWLCMKTKEPGLILPLTLGAFVLFHLNSWKSQKLKLVLLFLMLALLSFQIVPIEHLTAGRQVLRFNFDHLLRMTLRNYGVGYDDEAQTAFLSWEQVWPVSIARTLGFFTLWLLILFIVLYWTQRPGPKNTDQDQTRFLSHPLVQISALWAGIEILLMGLFYPEPRFFSSTMIPITILSVRLIWCVSGQFQKPWKSVLLIAAVASWSWTTLYTNAQHVIWLRQQIGQRVNRYTEAARIVYRDVFPNRSPNLKEIGYFYCPAHFFKMLTHPRFEDVVFHTDLPFESWNKTKTGTVQEFEQYAKSGAVYQVTYSKDAFAGNPKISILSVVSGVNNESFFEHVLYRLKRKAPHPLYIFKYRG